MRVAPTPAISTRNWAQAGKPVTAYDGQAAQLAAYAAAYWGDECLDRELLANIFISTTEPGRIDVIKHPDARDQYEFFRHCAAVWRHLKDYDPRRAAPRPVAP
jgi:hypothetical protein